MSLLHCFRMSFLSLKNRKVTTWLTLFSISLSIVLLLGIERLRVSARKSFESTISGVDLIVGARGGSLNLLLYSVFRIGQATNNLSLESYQKISRDGLVEWAIPISLGDSHKGSPVVATDHNYFDHFHYSGNKALVILPPGRRFEAPDEVVLGFRVADKLHYKIGDTLILAHGTGEVQFQDHADKPFRVVGILLPTGTPVDHSLHISLEAMNRIHQGWSGAHASNGDTDGKQEEISKPSDLTAFFVRLKSRSGIFQFQRTINEYPQEPLMAILPGVSLREFWVTLGLMERALFFISSIVFFVALNGIVISLLSSLNERRREIAILRSVGAKTSFLFSLLLVETLLLTLGGIILGIVTLYAVLFLSQGYLESSLGLALGIWTPTHLEFLYLALILCSAFIASLIPAWRAYRNSLADGLVVRI